MTSKQKPLSKLRLDPEDLSSLPQRRPAGQKTSAGSGSAAPPRIARPPRRRGTSGPWRFWTTSRRRCAGIGGPSSSIRRMPTGGIGSVMCIYGQGISIRPKRLTGRSSRSVKGMVKWQALAARTGNLGLIYRTRGDSTGPRRCIRSRLPLRRSSAALRDRSGRFPVGVSQAAVSSILLTPPRSTRFLTCHRS